MNNSNKEIKGLGGNQYKIGDRKIDLDGYTVMSDEDYQLLEDAGLERYDMIAPMHDRDDPDWTAVVEYVANYSGFNIHRYLENLENVKVTYLDEEKKEIKMIETL